MPASDALGSAAPAAGAAACVSARAPPAKSSGRWAVPPGATVSARLALVVTGGRQDFSSQA